MTNKGIKFLHFNSKHSQRDLPKSMLNAYQNRTVAAQALPANEIMSLANQFLIKNVGEDVSVLMSAGVTFVSKHDNYSREIGRNESIKKMLSLNMKVVGINVTETHVFVHLSPYKGVHMSLRLNKKTGFSTVTGQIIRKVSER